MTFTQEARGQVSEGRTQSVARPPAKAYPADEKGAERLKYGFGVLVLQSRGGVEQIMLADGQSAFEQRGKRLQPVKTHAHDL